MNNGIEGTVAKNFAFWEWVHQKFLQKEKWITPIILTKPSDQDLAKILKIEFDNQKAHLLIVQSYKASI